MPVSKTLCDLDSRFEDCKFFVEANDFEQLCLWREHHKETGWKEDSSGFLHKVGTLGKNPIMVSFSFATLYGHRVCFYYATSQVVDYKKIDRLLDKSIKKNYHCRCDAMNFSHCLSYLKSLKSK